MEAVNYVPKEEYPDYIPRDYDRIAVVRTEDDLVRARLSVLSDTAMSHINLIVCPRILKGDFNGLADALYEQPSRYRLFHRGPNALRRIHHNCESFYDSLTVDQKAAYDAVDRDMKVYADESRDLQLRVHPPGEEPYNATNAIAFDAHADGTPTPDFRYGVNYNEGRTIFFRNEDCQPSQIVSTEENITYYKAKEGARVFSFKPGDIWAHLCVPLTSIFLPAVHVAPSQKEMPHSRLCAFGMIKTPPFKFGRI